MGAGGSPTNLAGLVIFVDITQSGAEFTSEAYICPELGPSTPLNISQGNIIASEIATPSASSVCISSPLVGTFDSEDTFNATITGATVKSLLGYDVNISFEGNVGTNQMSGTFSASDGTTGNWAGTTASSFSGTYTGTINSSVNPSPVPMGVTLVVTQNSGVDIAGTAMLTNSSCFHTLSLNGGVNGGSFQMLDSTDSLTLGGVQVSPTQIVFSYYVNSGCSSGDHGGGTLTAQ